MDAQKELLSFLDLLELNEDDIDRPLKQLMERGKHSNKHLGSAIQLLQYKLLVNLQENTECENDEEFEFAVKLLKNLSSDNVDNVCKIIDIVLRLQPSKIVSKAEHLLQQILSNIEFGAETSTSSLLEKDTSRNTLLFLKVSDSILNATITLREKVSLLCLETPLEKLLDSTEDALKIHFLTNTVPRLVEGVVGYNILDRIWIFIQSLKTDKKENALKVLSCLSDYYLPTPDGKGDSKFVSDIIFQSNFWEIIIFGITSNDTAVRKISIYLTKKAIDCVMATKQDLNVISGRQTIFQWKKNNENVLKSMWNNYFILIDSLEEKQANIVLPSLKLFDSINIQDCWMIAAFNMGLKHENTQVRLKCIEYKLKTKIKNEPEAQILLEALNDINIYDQNSNYEELKRQTAELLADNYSFMATFKTITNIKWSPVPLYHITDVLANLKKDLSLFENDISKIIIDILKIPCNNVVLRKAVQINMVYFLNNCCKDMNWKDVANIYSHLHLTDAKFEENPFAAIIKQVSLNEEDKVLNLRILTEHYNNIDLIILYLYIHQEDINLLIDIINEKLNKLQEGINRQYSDKRVHLNDVVFLIQLLSKTSDENSFLHNINKLIARQNKTILQYILSLFSNEFSLTIENAAALCEKHNFEFDGKDLGGILLQLYKTVVLFLKDNPELDKAVLSIFTLKMLLKNPVMVASYEHEMLNLKRFIEIISSIEFKDAQNESVGRSKNVFYEKSCEIIYLLIHEEKDVDSCLKEVINYIENVLECGGYGCLKWILKIVNKIIKPLTQEENNFNMIQFINRVWTEIEELKSNNQYSPCIEQFVELITQDAVLKNAMYNNIVISYCNKIIEYGPVKTNPLYYLIRNLNSKDVKDYGHLIYVLCEILLYCPVPRKDQR